MKQNKEAWDYVYGNFHKLAGYYAYKYACKLKDLTLIHDFKTDILLEMFKACCKYSRLPENQMDKIMKTIPVYFFQNKVMRKENRIEKITLDETSESIHSQIIIENLEKVESLYDKYYEYFLSEKYKMNKYMAHEKLVLFEILYPSKEFKRFMFRNKDNLVVTANILYKYFRHKKKWGKNYFDNVLHNVKKLVA